MKKLYSAIFIFFGAILMMTGVASAQETPVDKAAVTEESCNGEWVPAVYEDVLIEDGYTEVIEEAYVQRYSWTGGPHEPDTAPTFPSGEWQANVQGDPHDIGEPGAYFVSHGNSGNGDWFYLEYVDAVTVEHPPVYEEQLVKEGYCIPTDVCPNIDGDQATIPDGMVIEDGKCVAPVIVSPAVDVCPNIDGNQEEIPTGFNKDSEGDCIEEIPPCDTTDPEAECYIPPPSPVTPPPVVNPPVDTPPPAAVPMGPPTVRVPLAAASPAPAVLDGQLAYTGANDYLPALALTGFGLLMSGVFLTRKAARI